MRRHPHQDHLEAAASAVVASLEARHGEDLVSAVLYGSVARGEAVPGSDVDLVLVFRALPDGRVARFRVFYDALREHEAHLDTLATEGVTFDWSPILMTADEARHRSPLYLDMIDDARLLIDRGGFFRGVLDDMRARLDELGAQKIHLPDGSWYWDLMPGRRPGEVISL